MKAILFSLLFFAAGLITVTQTSGLQDTESKQDSTPTTKKADDDTKKAADSKPAVASKKGSWPMWGGTPSRNMVAKTKAIDLDFDLRENKNVLWSMPLGSQTYGNPVVADGKVFVGTNNGNGYRPKYKKDEDKGVLLCFDQEKGTFLWQLTRDKLPTGRVNDWPLQGICSTPVIEGDRMWVVTNRCELMCIDTNGFHDGENDGEFKDEVDKEKGDADIIWNLDMMGDELGVFPHNLATSSPVIHGDTVYLLTSNGVDEAHLEIPSPRSPSFLAVDKNSGKVKWEDSSPRNGILHGAWGSPAIGKVNGKIQIYFPGGDGWLYAFTEEGKLIWKFDLNPKETKWELGGAGTRNAIISTPVFYDNSVLLSVGQDPEHGEGVGHLWRIDATKTGDISAELGEINTKGKPNPNSGVIWHYGGVNEEDEEIFRRTMSTVSVHDGMVFASDLSGFIHCVDLKTGKRHWEHDMLSGVWGSTLVTDGKIFIGNEDGKLVVLEAKKDAAKVLKEYDTVNFSSIYSTPTFTNGIMYLSDRARLYAVKVAK